MKFKYRNSFIISLLTAGTIFFLVLIFLAIGDGNFSTPSTNGLTKNDLGNRFQNIPLYFEPNVGQAGLDSKFLTRGHGYEMKLSNDKAVLVLTNGYSTGSLEADSEENAKVSTLAMSLANSNKEAKIAGEIENGGKVNYLFGNDRSKWLTDIPTFQKVRYSKVYPGIDLVYYGKQTQLEFDFVVSPGADPKQIRMDFEGAEKIAKNSDGDLVLTLESGEVLLHKPILYQTKSDGTRQIVDGEFALADIESVRFEIGDYDSARQLVIDPILSYSTFLPGAQIGYAIAVDNDGNAIVTGRSSGNVPTTTGGNTGGVFVTKFNPQGSNLIFSTRIGGNSSSETGRAIKIDSSGNVVVAGTTSSNDFPAVNPVKEDGTFYVSDNAANSWSTGGNLNEFQILKVAPSFQDANLLYAAAGNKIYKSLDAGNVWSNVSNNLPVSSSIQVVAVNPTNAQEVYATPAQQGLYRSVNGGSTWSQITNATLPGSGVSDIGFAPNDPQTVYLASGGGVRKTSDGGTTWQSVNNGLPANDNMRVLKIDPSNPSTLYVGTNQNGVYKSTDAGVNWAAINTGITGNNSNIIRKIAIDPNNPSTVYVGTGNYASPNLIFKTLNGGASWSLTYTTQNAVNNEIGDLAVSRTNSSRIYVGIVQGGFFRSDDGGTTWTRAENGLWSNNVLSIVESPIIADRVFVGSSQGNSNDDAFVFKLNPNGNGFVFSTRLGGSNYDRGFALALDAQGNAYVGGTTVSLNFPTANAVQTGHASDGGGFISEDGFVTKIASGGSAIIYSTYLGGNSYDYVNGLAVDSAGSLAIAGQTQSSDFPVLNALQPNLMGLDAYLTKLSPAGNSIEFSTFWGTNNVDSGNDVEFDNNSNIVLVGATSAPGLTTVNAIQSNHNGGTDGFITKFNPGGSQVLFSSYFGGRDNDRIQNVDLDANGDLYVAGTSNSKDFPQLRSVKSRSPYFRSSNGAAKWSNFNNNIFSEIFDFGFHPSDPLIIYAATAGGFIKTSDGGDTWNPVVNIPSAQSYNSVEFDPQNANKIYLGYRDTNNNTGRIAVSIDGGSSWNTLAGFSAGSDSVYKIIVAPTDSQTIYAATYFAVYKTIDGGTTWARKTQSPLTTIIDYDVDKTNPSRVFIARANSGGGIWRSIDGGTTFQQLTNGITGAYADFVVLDPQQPSTVYAKTQDGIFRSIDGGDSWTHMNGPFAGRDLIVDPFSSSTLYVTRSSGATGNDYGMYRSLDGGDTWTLFNEGMPVESYFKNVEADSRIRGSLHGSVELDSATNDDIFVSKIDASANSLVYSSVLGGDIHTGSAFQDVTFGMAVTPGGSAFLTGGTTSPDFPVSPDAYYTTQNNTTLFVTRFDPSWTVNGRITDQQSGNAVQGVELTLNGGETLTTESNGLGKYVFQNVAENDSFNLVPKKLGYDFTPPGYSVSSLDSDQTLDFTGVYTTYTIQGHITFGQANLANVIVELDGSQTGSTVSDGNGNFTFTVPKYGNYSVRPVLDGYIFTPPTMVFENVTSNLTADFAAREGYAISGQILRNGNPVPDVAVNLSGSENQTVITDSEGRYSIDAGINGNYSIMPVSDIYGFSPISQSFTNLTTNQTGDFTAYRLSYTVKNLSFIREKSFSESQTEIFNMDDEGFGLEQLTSTTNTGEGQPAWSPNGRRIAYVTSPYGNARLFVMNFDGTNNQALLPDMFISNPEWSSDSRKIIFSGQVNASSAKNIFTVNSDGTDLQQLTNDSVGNYSPDWSPDGSKIAFSRSGKLHTMDPDGSNIQPLTTSSIFEDDPDWSPDGSELVFTGSSGSEPRTYLVNSDGTNMRRLTNEDRREIQAAWSPDGDEIAYIRDGSYGNIFVIDADGSNARQVTNDNLDKYNPVWRPRLNRFTTADFDGDARTDISIFRPVPAEWWYLRSSDGGNSAFQFGQSTDTIVPADFTGDGKTDIAFWRDGQWFVLRSEDSSFYAFPFGTTGDIPATGDFDGDGRDDPAVFRSASATWFILNSSGGTTIQQFGLAGDVPIVEDYDGDGRDDIAVFRPSVSEWFLNRSTDGFIGFSFGAAGDTTPVVGDYTGDRKADIAFFQPSTGEWLVLRSEDTSYYAFPFGTTGDIPVPGDYDGDGNADPAVFRPSINSWFLLQSTGGFEQVQFGIANDIPVPSAYVPSP